MRTVLFIIFVLFIQSFCFSQKITKASTSLLNIEISPGCNISKLKVDSLDVNNVVLPLLGLGLKKSILTKFNLRAVAQFSMRGANHVNPIYKYRNMYIDIQVIPQVRFFNFLKVELGYQRSVPVSSKVSELTGDNESGMTSVPVTGYVIQDEVLCGIQFALSDQFDLAFRYSLPLSGMQYTNFQFVFTYSLDEMKFFNKYQRTYRNYEKALKEPLRVQKLIVRNKGIAPGPEVGKLLNCEIMVLSGNAIKKIPVEIGELANLEKLDLSNNEISEVPKEIGNLSNLQELHLENNQIKEIPFEAARITNLHYFYLFGNNLIELPAGVLSLSNLKKLCIDSTVKVPVTQGKSKLRIVFHTR